LHQDQDRKPYAPATGITAYLKTKARLKSRSTLRTVSERATKLYDLRQDEISRSEVERIAI
jgi:hypothetical protein